MRKPKRLLKQTGAFLLALAVLGSSVGHDIFIVSAAENEPAATCICETRCQEGAIQEDCPVCSGENGDLTACTGSEPTPEEGPAAVCTCETKCQEGAIQEGCPVCSGENGDLTACTGSEPTPEEGPAAVCTCETKCQEGAIQEGCPVCSGENGDLTACTGSEPTSEEELAAVCTCQTKCQEGAAQEDCPVCGGETGDLTACTGSEPTSEEVPAAVCTCQTKCQEGAIQEDCPVCGGETGDLTACTGSEPTPEEGPAAVCTCKTKCQEGEVQEGCPVCSGENGDLTACTGIEQTTDEIGSSKENKHQTEFQGEPEYQEQEAPLTTLWDEEGILPDNEELFAGYVQQQLYGGTHYGISTFGNYGERLLDGLNLELYQILKEEIAEIAAGNRSSTEITVSPADLNNVPTSCKVDITLTEEEIELINNEIMTFFDAASDQIRTETEKETNSWNYDMKQVLDCLLMDCPYELYWFLKTDDGGLRSSIGAYQASWSGVLSTQCTVTVTFTDFRFSFAVAEEYRGLSQYVTDTSTTSAATAAAANAQQIVNENAGKTDYEKLQAYKEAICDQVSYNDFAADETTNTPYGNPWQLIWVFDGDSNTNVVCEGYSKAFQYLCDLTAWTGNVSCYTVTGNMSGGTGAGAHMWNIVTIDGSSYLVDVTNCDTGTVGAPDKLFLAGADGEWKATYTNSDVSYQYDGDTKAMYGADILTLATGKYKLPGSIANKNYATAYTYSGAAITAPADNNFTTTAGALSFTWYKDSVSEANQLSATPVDAGSYILKVDAAPTDTLAAATLEVSVTINPATPTIAFTGAAKNQTAEFTGTAVGIMEPTVTLVNEDVYNETTYGAITYSYVSSDAAQGTAPTPGLPINPGTYTVYASLPASQNYTGATTSKENACTLTIEAPQLTGTVALEGTLTYGETVTASVDNLNSADAALTYRFYVGDKTDPAQSGSENTFYLGADTIGQKVKVEVTAEDYSGSVTSTSTVGVAKRAITITPGSNQSKTYGDADPELTYDITAGALVTGDSMTGALTRGEGENAGSYPITQGTLTVDNTAGYEITFTEGIAFTIGKAEYTGDTGGATSASYGSQGTYNLTALNLPEGYQFGSLTVSDTENLLNGDPSVTGTTLSYQLVHNADNAGKTATVTIPVTSDNYNGFDITITIQVADKTAQTLVFTESEMTKIYGDAAFTNPLTGAQTDVTYESKNTDVATVDNSGQVTIQGAGSTTITATAKEDSEYQVGSASYTLTVNPKSLTVTAGDYRITKTYDGTTETGTATTTGALEVTGVLDDDEGQVTVNATGEYTDPNVGGQSEMTLNLSLSGAKKDNYQLSNDTVMIPCSITPKPITLKIVVTGTYTYDDGAAITPTFTVSYDNDGTEVQLTENTDYHWSISNNVDAGTGSIFVSAVEGGNYTWSGNVKENFTIGKADYTGTKTAGTSAECGSTAEFDLSSLLPSGYQLGKVRTEDTNSILSGSPTMSGTTLHYELADNAENAGKTAKILVSVESRNYYTFELEITVTAKPTATPKPITPVITITGTYTYDGGTAITPTFTVSYNNGDIEVALVEGIDYTTSLSNNINAGTGTISITPVNGGNYSWTDPVTGTFTIDQAPQTALGEGEGYTINYSEETIAIEGGCEIHTAKENGSTIQSDAKITPGTTVYIRRAETANYKASDWTEISVPARPNLTLTQTEVTASGFSVKVTGVPSGAAVSYQATAKGGTPSDSDTAWQESAFFTGLKAGTTYTVYVKCGATDKSFAAQANDDCTTAAAEYTISIPEQATAGGSAVSISVNQNQGFDLGTGGQVNVKIVKDASIDENGSLILKRENADNIITSAILVGGKTWTDYSQNIATIKNTNDSINIKFAEPTQTDIPAGSYTGTVTFAISYSEAE